jgi:hypothetical protein
MSESRHRKPCVCPVDVARVNRPAPLRGPELVPLLLPAPPLVIDDQTLVDVGWKPIEDRDRFWRER